MQSLTLAGCGIGAAGLHQLATDPAFAALSELDATSTDDDPGAWEAVFNSNTLTAMTTMTVGAVHLPTYARAPMAERIRDLTVKPGRPPIAYTRQAWLELIERAPPPRRLELSNHHPGRAVFAAMRRKNWLRDLRKLEIRGDSQGGAFGDYDDRRMAGVHFLFGPRSMRRLADLDLHEACGPTTLAVLGNWPGIANLEKLDVTSDYYGYLVPSRLGSAHNPGRLRTLSGLVLITEEDLARFLATFPLERFSYLSMAFRGEYDETTHHRNPQISGAVADRFIRSERLARLTGRTVGLDESPEVYAQLAQTLADPTVMPRLRQLSFYGRTGNDKPPPFDGLRARFGHRFHA